MHPADVTTPTQASVLSLLRAVEELPASDLIGVVHELARELGAESAHLHVADYGLLTLRRLGPPDPGGATVPIEGTLAGRSFATGDIVSSGESPTTAWIPLTEGTERLGVLEVAHHSWNEEIEALAALLAKVLALVLVTKRRYTDVFQRMRRAKPLSVAAEMQWDLLPPLTSSMQAVTVSGILEPAYSVGGDSFDYALNPRQLDFAIIDAVGRGTPAALLAVAAISSLRNVRREEGDLTKAYRDTDGLLREQFGYCRFVTALLGSLAVDTGVLTWINAGHPLPLLVRDGNYIGELVCPPSMPMGLGGSVVHVATEALQPGDRVLFYTDGVTESRAPSGEEFGTARLADHLVRASLDGMTPAETVRRLSASILRHNETGPSDDATLLLVEYRRPDETADQPT